LNTAACGVLGRPALRDRPHFRLAVEQVGTGKEHPRNGVAFQALREARPDAARVLLLALDKIKGALEGWVVESEMLAGPLAQPRRPARPVGRDHRLALEHLLYLCVAWRRLSDCPPDQAEHGRQRQAVAHRRVHRAILRRRAAP
jgi:hypothetical protein